jgi:hypothetical protein
MMRNFQRRITIAYCLLLVAARLQATSVVVVQESQRLVIGADSLRRVGGTPAATVCKIQPIGNGHYAAASGLVGGQEFDVWAMIREAAVGGGDLAAKISRLDAILLEPLKQTIRGSRTVAVVEVVFVGRENGESNMVARRYRVEGSSRGVEIDRCPRCRNIAFLTLGQSTPIAREIERNPKFIEREPATVVRDAINIAMKNRPMEVGPPINILEIDQRGARWLEGGDVCPWKP